MSDTVTSEDWSNRRKDLLDRASSEYPFSRVVANALAGASYWWFDGISGEGLA